MGKFWAQSQKPTAVPNYLRTEYEWNCVFPEFEGIWTRYIENEERPLPPPKNVWIKPTLTRKANQEINCTATVEQFTQHVSRCHG